MRILKSVGLFAAGVAATLAFGLLMKWSTHRPAPADMASVAADWSTNIGRLGIESIYPPQEDFEVGDIFAVITDAGKALSTSETFAGRAVKIWHVDMRSDIEDAYSELPIFPETLSRPTDANDVWRQAQTNDSVFASVPHPRHSLPLVTFPAFSIGHARRAEVELGLAESAAGGLFSGSGSSDDTVELKIPLAETYGVASILATGTLKFFCREHKPACADTELRTQLSSLVGDAIWNKAIKVEVMLVNRVYLARSIEEFHQSDSAMGTKIKLAAKLKAAVSELEAQKPSETSGIPAAEADKINKAIDMQVQKLNGLIAETASGVPSGSISVSAADSSSIGMSQTFQRPIAVGFRAIYQTPNLGE
jgi:hypothetical protein